MRSTACSRAGAARGRASARGSTRWPTSCSSSRPSSSSPSPGLGLANRLPIWLTVLIISRDVVIVLTVAIVNLAIGPRTFRPSIYGKIATATYIVTAVIAMFFNYLGYHSLFVDGLHLRVARDHTRSRDCTTSATRQGPWRAERNATTKTRRREEQTDGFLRVFVSSWLPLRAFVARLVSAECPQAGCRRDVSRHVHHRSHARRCAQSRRVFHEARAGRRVRGDDVPSGCEVRDGAGRRSDFEGSGEAQPVRDRRPERGQGRGARGEDDARVSGGGARSGPAGQRRRAVLRRPRRPADARRSIHGVRPGVRRDGCACRRSRKRRSMGPALRPIASRSSA